ncbi:MAG: hypothetical protein RIT04_155 [Candidatus Parcubacteria bacterium]|jgi:SAM-dependent methyltransferase
MKNKLIIANLVLAFASDKFSARAIKRATKDYIQTFIDIGMGEKKAGELCACIMHLLRKVCSRALTLKKAEVLIVKEMSEYRVDGRGIREVLNEKLANRSNIVVSQIAPYLKSVTGPVIDFGCGDGSISQILHDQMGLNITGYDVTSYRLPSVSIPMVKFDGKTVPVADGRFEAAVVTNVIHHEADNERIIKELTRVVSKKLVVIETVPNPTKNKHNAEAEKSRVFMNDYLYNRLFQFGAEIPVPGTYETAENWPKRFAEHGWKTEVSVDLGIDQKIIRDRHHLYVFVK